MGLLSSPVSSLINGVSQQPASLRFPSQVEAQENAYSSIASGLTKRHPSQHVAGALTGVNGITNAFTHFIDRASDERYAVVAYQSGGDPYLKVFDLLTGAVKNVYDATTGTSAADATDLAYINGSTMSADLRAVTVVDHTWIVNTAKDPAMTAAGTPTRKTDPLVVIWKYNHGHTYEIKIEDKVFKWRSRQADVGTGQNLINEYRKAAQNQGYIAEKLYILLAGLDDASMAAAHNFNALDTATADVMHVTSTRVTATDAGAKSPSGNGGVVAADNNAGQGLNGDAGSNAAAGGYDQWVVRQTGPVLHIYREDGADFDISVGDDHGDESMSVIKDEVQTLADLPTKASHGMKVKIVGDEETGVDDDYYVEFSVDGTAGDEAYRPDRQAKATADGNPVPIAATDTEALADGVWQETTAANVVNTLNPATMPHKLIRRSDGHFAFVEGTWTTMPVGDAASNPQPSFIGSGGIRDVFFFKNRLGFLADDNVIMSETGEYGNFWRTSIVQLLDSDPIDVAIAHPSVSKPNHAIPFLDGLVLFTDTSQFHLQGDDILSPKTTTIQYSSEFENSSRVRPVPTGRSIFFAQKRDAFAGVREYYQVVKDEMYDALEVTAHVPTYIPGDITHMAGSTHDNILVVKADGDPDGLYVYKYLVGKDEKLQSAWSRYTLENSTILNMGWIDTDLYILCQRTNASTSNVELFIEKMLIEPGLTDVDDAGASIGFVCNLDRRITENECASVAYSSGTGNTTYTLPYTRNAGTYQIVIRKSATVGLPVGSQLTVENPDATTGTTLVVSGDHTTDEVFIGTQYSMSVELSRPYIKPQPNAPIYASGRYQLMYGHLIYHESDYFRVEVSPTYRTTRTTTFNGGILGATAAVGGRGTTSGQLKFPIYARNDQATITIINDTPLTSSIMGLEYEAQFNPRATRIG